MATATPPPNEIHQLRLEQLAAFLRESELILAEWDAYSEEHTDADGWPHDGEAYGLRAAVRDAETWRAFNRVRHCAKQLLATAEAQLHQLDARSSQHGWPWQLRTLHNALDRLDALQREWLATRQALPASIKPGTEAYDDMLDDRNAEAWHYLGQWAVHGQALLDIDTAAHQARLPQSATTPTRAPAAAVVSSAKPSATRR